MFERFYFNADENFCADETWLINYLFEETLLTKEEIKNELHTRRSFRGWFACDVSDTIRKKFS